MVLHATAHLDAEVLSAIGQIHRAGTLTSREAGERLQDAAEVRVTRHLLGSLVPGAWRRRQRLGLMEALYVELASVLDVPLLTTDAALGRATRRAEVIVRFQFGAGGGPTLHDEPAGVCVCCWSGCQQRQSDEVERNEEDGARSER